MNHIAVKKILHIAPHLGGGVGSTILSYLSKTEDNGFLVHKMACLDYANQYAIDTAKKFGFPLFGNMSKKKQELLNLVADSDIVLIHWWNHPLLYDFLTRSHLPASRVVIWSLIVGSPPPNNFTDKIFEYSDIFVFSTPVSYKAKEVLNLTDEKKKKLRVVWATGTVDKVKSLKSKKHLGYNVGYIGTVDYAKMHSDFLDICKRVDIPDANFIVVGGPNGKQLEREAEHLGIGGKFNFTGFVSEAEKWNQLSSFDVFGYPLASHHYGTCDLALQEAMTAGVVPVVLANPMESHIVKNGVTGIVARNKEEYIKALHDLRDNPELRNFLSKNAREYAIKTFSLKKMENEWNEIFNEALKIPKTSRKWKIDKKIKDVSPKDVFLESLGDYGKDFTSYCNAKNKKEKKNAMERIKKLAESDSWRSKTKSTVHQYHSFFPDDKYLSFWSKLMKNVQPKI